MTFVEMVHVDTRRTVFSWRNHFFLLVKTWRVVTSLDNRNIVGVGMQIWMFAVAVERRNGKHPCEASGGGKEIFSMHC